MCNFRSSNSLHFNLTNPTETSALYTNPIHLNLNSTTEIRAKAFKEYWIPNNIVSNTYIITGTVPAPSFNPPAGSYLNAIDVIISCALEETVIRYTLDETEPNENSMLFTAPIHINQDTMLKAKAFKLTGYPVMLFPQFIKYLPLTKIT